MCIHFFASDYNYCFAAKRQNIALKNSLIIGDEDDLPPVSGAPGGGRLSGGGHGNPVGNPAAALYGPAGQLPGTHHNIPNMHCNPAVKNNRGPPSMPKPPPRPQQNITQVCLFLFIFSII